MNKKVKFSIILMVVAVMLFSMFALACGEKEKPEYNITVINGKADVYTAVEGTTITLTANTKTGNTFTEWTSDASGLVITNNSFVMPASDVTVTANYSVNSYSLTVSSGSAKVDGTAVTGKVKYGAEVTLTANAPASGYTFAGWNSSDVTVTNDKFSMPAKDVAVSAKYEKEFNTLTIAAGKGVTFAGGGTTAQIKKDEPLPAVVNNKAGTDIAGFYDNSDESAFWNYTSYELSDKASSGWNGVVVPAFTMPANDTTVAPFFVDKGARALIPGSSNMGNIAGITSHTTENAGEIRVGTQFFETDIGMQIGAAFEYGGDNGGRFRIQTMCGISNDYSIKAGSHTFYFWFKNMGTETLTFKARQVNSGNGSSTGNNPDVSTDEITLTAGQSKRASITIALTANNNALTFIDLGQDQTDAKLGVVMSKNP